MLRNAWRMCLFLAALAILILAAPALAATYYVSPAGNDGALGTSAATAWRSLAKVASSPLRAGDVVQLARGGVWRETLNLPSSGITLTAYGSGNMPVISGANVVSGLYAESQSAGLTWVGSFSTQPSQVFVNGERGQRVGSVSQVNATRKWHWANGRIVHSAPDMLQVEGCAWLRSGALAGNYPVVIAHAICAQQK